MASKIIVLGDVNGQLRPVFTKLSTLHAKNAFAFAIVSGNLFAEDNDSISELLTGEIEIPLPTYFTVGTTTLPNRIIERLEKDDEICPNLHFLGKRSVTKTLEGVKIVALGGRLDTSIIGGTSQDNYLPFHTTTDAKVLKGANSADILLTPCWPLSVTNGSKIDVPADFAKSGEPHISELCAILKPRYHFSTSPFFFEREPFIHAPNPDAPEIRPLTRFISLAPHGNTTKQKALYAFSLSPNVDPNAPLPAGTTASPFDLQQSAQRKRNRDEQEKGGYSRYDNNGQYKRQRGRGRDNYARPPPGPNECFFCLSNPTLSTHLISSIGEDAYLTTAKGPLTTSDTYTEQGLDFPSHALIIPLTHSPTLAGITTEDNSKQKTFDEMHRFKRNLQKMVAKKSGGKLGAITYEISKQDGVHTHWQFLPLPVNLIRKGLVEAAFRVEAENHSYPPFEARDPGLGDEWNFFRVWIWSPTEENSSGEGEGSEGGDDKGTEKCLTLSINDSFRFSLQFGRIVLAKLLGLEGRLQWRDCAQSEDEEKLEIDRFKASFKDWDFTLD